MFRARLALFLLLFSAPVFSADRPVRELLVRYKTRPTQGRTLAVPPSVQTVSAQIHTAAAMATYQAARSILERTAVVKMDSTDLEAELAKWRRRSDVEFVEPNRPMHVSITPNDPSYFQQWALNNTGTSGSPPQTGGHDIFDPSVGTEGDDVAAEGAWSIQTGDSNIIVAVIDAGINITHPDLAANMDLVDAFDFGDNDSNPDDDCTNSNIFLNSHGHGTHVTGIVGAVGDNGVGVAGINWHGKIMPLKVADSSCGIFTDDVVNAIVYATSHGADVISMSLGGDDSASLQAAVNAAYSFNVVLVAAAGNESTESTTNSFPAAYPNVIAVAATDRNDQLASFSNRGTWVDIAAPGVGILSTYPASLGSYGYLSGTSMATPLVSGVAALILAENPGLTPAAVKARLQAAADNIDAANSSLIGKFGAGRLNAQNALFSITSVSPSTAPNTGPQQVILTGFNMSSTTAAYLEHAGQSPITGTGLDPHTSSVTVTFDLTGVVGGRWDVVLARPGGGLARLENGLGVLSNTFDAVVLSPSQSYTRTVQSVAGTTHTVVWPVGTVSQTITLYLDGAPTLPAVSASDPYTATGDGIELTPSVSTLTFNKSFTLTLAYQLADLANPANEAGLIMARYDTDTTRWVPLASTVDTTARTVTASISHLSIFAILQSSPSANLGQAIAYPNPFRADRGHTRITFDFLTAGSHVRIYDVAGNLVRELANDSSGQIIWSDLKNDSGDDVASGVYFYLITDPAGNKERGRIGVIR